MEDKNYSSGVGFLGLLALIFITLKITGYIKWSWLWVLAPIWGVPALVVVLILVIFITELITRKKEGK